MLVGGPVGWIVGKRYPSVTPARSIGLLYAANAASKAGLRMGEHMTPYHVFDGRRIRLPALGVRGTC
jgi:hypothetical protein